MIFGVTDDCGFNSPVKIAFCSALLIRNNAQSRITVSLNAIGGLLSLLIAALNKNNSLNLKMATAIRKADIDEVGDVLGELEKQSPAFLMEES